ncbi:MAG: GNAT family N-acetyltransferase [Candidatus Thorarchaeota archaeon]
MIREVTIDTFGEFEFLIDSFQKSREIGFFQSSSSFTERIKSAIVSNNLKVFAKYENGKPIGFIALGNQSSTINALFVDEMADDIIYEERMLFEHGFEYLSHSSSIVKFSGSSGGAVSDTLGGYFEEKGFKKYDRKHMTLTRDRIDELKSPILPDGYYFQVYEESMRDAIADLVFYSNIGNIDVEVFPDFFGSFSNVLALIERIEQNRYGVYKPLLSQVLMHNESPAGVCFLTMTTDDTGYIPDICISKELRRMGLGRALLIYSMKKMMEKEQALERINLDVTKKNVAKQLYESLGYEDVRHYSMYIWRKSEQK